MGHITQDHLKQAKIVVPPIELISKLDAKLQPIMLKQQILENQNQELTPTSIGSTNADEWTGEGGVENIAVRILKLK